MLQVKSAQERLKRVLITGRDLYEEARSRFGEKEDGVEFIVGVRIFWHGSIAQSSRSGIFQGSPSYVNRHSEPSGTPPFGGSYRHTTFRALMARMYPAPTYPCTPPFHRAARGLDIRTRPA